MNDEADSGKGDTERRVGCNLCGEIGESAYACQKSGWPESDTFLPAAAAKLKTVEVIKDSGSRKKLVQRCPGCGDYFIYELDYEFLAGGSEDEETLVRIKKREVNNYR